MLKELNGISITVKVLTEALYYERFPGEMQREKDLFKQKEKLKQDAWKNPLIYKANVTRDEVVQSQIKASKVLRTLTSEESSESSSELSMEIVELERVVPIKPSSSRQPRMPKVYRDEHM